jgi:hypothetical protein
VVANERQEDGVDDLLDQLIPATSDAIDARISG